jgi:hypothetical protein
LRNQKDTQNLPSSLKASQNEHSPLKKSISSFLVFQPK